MIVDSFQSCGITVATDGSKDDEIHCMKSGQPAEGAKELLRTKTRKLLRDERDDDPFTDSENESEDEFESSSSSDELSLILILQNATSQLSVHLTLSGFLLFVSSVSVPQ